MPHSEGSKDYRSGGKLHSKRSGKTKVTGAGFGGPMAIPEAGGTTSRVHGSGYDKKTSKPKQKKAKTRHSTTAMKYSK